jgi:hypothetical protein
MVEDVDLAEEDRELGSVDRPALKQSSSSALLVHGPHDKSSISQLNLQDEVRNIFGMKKSMDISVKQWTGMS